MTKRGTASLAFGLIAGLGWGLGVALLDGLPLLWQGTPWPHLVERLLALAYLASIYGLLGALLGVLLAAFWSAVIWLLPARTRLRDAASRHRVFLVLAPLAVATLSVALGQRFGPGPVGWVIIALLMVLCLLLGWLVSRGIAREGSSLSVSPAQPQARRAPQIVISALFLVALIAAVSASAIRQAYAGGRAQNAVGQPAAGQPNVVLITASGLRADHLGAYGYDPAISPNLDALAVRGVRFEQAVAPGSWGRPSTAALLTSLYPGALGYRRDAAGVQSPAPDSARTTLAESLRAAGYRTGAVVASPWLDAPGFAQGFDSYVAARAAEPFDAAAMRSQMLGRILGCAKNSAACRLFLDGHSLVVGTPLLADQGDEAINERSVRFLDRTSGTPFFLWVNYDDALPPYNLAEPFKPILEDPSASPASLLGSLGYWQLGDPFTAREVLLPRDRDGLTTLYDGEVQRVDRLVGQLLAELEARGMIQNTIVVVTSDHGQELGDHGAYTYGHALYDEIVRVPMILAGPGITPAGRVVHIPVSLIDLAPTLAEMAGTTLSEEMLGASFLPALRGETLVERPVFSEALYRVPFDQQAILSSGYKLIYHEADGQVELYDLQADPAESRNLSATNPDAANTLRDTLQEWKSRMRELERTGLPRAMTSDPSASKLW